MRTLFTTAKQRSLVALLLCTILFIGCSKKVDVPKLLGEGKAAFYKEDYRKATEAFKACADADDSQGQYWLAYTTMWTKGENSTETDSTAMSKEERDKYIYDLFKKSADQNDGDGYYGLAMCYNTGTGVAKDETKYNEYLDKSVELNSAVGKAAKGTSLVQKGGAENIQKGIALLKESAEAGCYEGKTYLGAYYLDGTGVEKDVDKGLGLVREGAEHNSRTAHSILARLYFAGTYGVSQDYTKAFQHALKGQADGTTCYILSLCYANGVGTKEDEKIAATYARESAKCGFAAGQSLWAGFCASGYGTQEEALNWFMKAADQDYVYAIYAVGEYLLKGTAGKTDWAMAKRYLKKAAAMGSEEAQNLLSTYGSLLSYY
jgi:TPR repeat protein